MDGTITEGRFIEPPRTFEAYMSLAPYDSYVHHVYNKLALKHEIFIMTARSDRRADIMIQSWLNREGMMYPTSIITGIPQPAKWFLAHMMNCDVMIDDSPNVAEQVYERKPEFILMDNPHWKKNQEHDPYPHIRRITSWKDLGEHIETIDIRESYKSLTNTQHHTH
jgi:uncharacterized HAD superfamily protein